MDSNHEVDRADNNNQDNKSDKMDKEWLVQDPRNYSFAKESLTTQKCWWCGQPKQELDEDAKKNGFEYKIGIEISVTHWSPRDEIVRWFCSIGHKHKWMKVYGFLADIPVPERTMIDLVEVDYA